MGSTRIECFAPEYGWEQISGREVWKTIFAGCLAGQGEAAGTFLPVSSCFFLICGEEGIGKYTLAAAFAGEAQRAGYQVYSVCAEDLAQEGRIAEDTLKQLRTDLQQEKTFLLLRGLDRYLTKKDKKAASMIQLADFLEELRGGNFSRIVAATAERENRIPKRLRRMFQLCCLQNPSRQEIASFWEQTLSGLPGEMKLQDGLTCEELAAECDGFTYGRLRDLADNLKRYLAGLRLREEEAAEPVISRERFLAVKESVYRPGKKKQVRKALLLQRMDEQMEKYGRPDHSQDDAQPPADPLEGLEAEADEMEEAAKLLEEISGDLQKKPEDYTDEELRELGYEPQKEAPEDAESLAEMSEEEREALCAILDFDL